MGCQQAKPLKDEGEVSRLCAETGFSANQIQRFYCRFCSLDRGDKGHLSAEDLLRLPELSVNPLGERIVFAMFKEELPEDFEFQSGREDGGLCGLQDIRIPFRSFVRCFARLRPMAADGTKEAEERPCATATAKLRFVFRMFDLNEDGYITLSEVFALLKTLSPNVDDEELVRFSEDIMIEATPSDAHVVRETLPFEDFGKSSDSDKLVEELYFRFSN